MTSFTCSCGETLHVPENYSGTKAYCLRCEKSVDIPESVRVATLEERAKAETVRKPGPPTEPDTAIAPVGASASDTGEQPPHYELVRNADGKENWKITCF